MCGIEDEVAERPSRTRVKWKKRRAEGEGLGCDRVMELAAVKTAAI